MIDVSDGLAPEVRHICEQSKVGAIIYTDNVPIREETRKPINRIINREAICQGCGAYVEDVTNVKGSLLCDRCAKEQG